MATTILNTLTKLKIWTQKIYTLTQHDFGLGVGSFAYKTFHVR